MTAEHEWVFSEKMPDEALFAELRKRGWTFSAASSGRSVVTPPGLSGMEEERSERNTAPEEKWLEVWQEIQKTGKSKYDSMAILHLEKAITHLYLLLEPPSVRERRLNDGG